MSVRNVVAIGASAGGVPALSQILGGLPPDFPAAVLVVMHTPPFAESRLPEVLSRAGPLPAKHAVDREPLVSGQVYVAPPDHHLLVRRGWLELSRGPRENRSRPAIDPLFRSAARAYGDRSVGVILSGALYDGAAGLLAIDGRGGLCRARGGHARVPRPTHARATGTGGSRSGHGRRGSHPGENRRDVLRAGTRLS